MPPAPSSTRTLPRVRRLLGGGSVARWVIATAVCRQARYFQSIRPTFTVLEPGRVGVRLVKRRAVTNHLGTVHAIAMCNAAELAGGTLVELTLPDELRWIPVGMTVTYDKLAKTDLVVTAELSPDALAAPGDVVVPVVARDTAGQAVFTAQITMRLSARAR